MSCPSSEQTLKASLSDSNGWWLNQIGQRPRTGYHYLQRQDIGARMSLTQSCEFYATGAMRQLQSSWRKLTTYQRRFDSGQGIDHIPYVHYFTPSPSRNSLRIIYASVTHPLLMCWGPHCRACTERAHDRLQRESLVLWCRDGCYWGVFGGTGHGWIGGGW